MDNIYTHLVRIAKSDRTQRLNTITDILTECGICHRLQHFETSTNAVISYSGHNDFDIIFIAHHDIASGTIQGANDNTASVAVLIALSEWLQTQNLHYNTHIAFTDHEERIGAMLSENVTNEDRFRIITSIGSYQLLKTFSAARVKAVINLEMSGIGDRVFIAESSGNVPCSAALNSRIAAAADQLRIRHSSVRISNSDLLSAHVRKMHGTVIGALPAGEYVKFGSYPVPQAWATMHTPQDTIDKIEQPALEMMLTLLKTIVDK
ncbi:MAG: M28 family peptidase [Spirochaetales bacterium]|nr:M28 family peptidase [Spirochaetales bacterium]